MKWTSLFAICALAFLSSACEKHPIAGEEPSQEHGEVAKPSEGAKPAEAAKPVDAEKK
jgi:hypothetical protein